MILSSGLLVNPTGSLENKIGVLLNIIGSFVNNVRVLVKLLYTCKLTGRKADH
jgi:hypothetical protein